MLFDRLLSPKKSPNIQESNMWIVWICETVAYSEGWAGCYDRTAGPLKALKPRVQESTSPICGLCVDYSDVGTECQTLTVWELLAL